MSDFEVVPVGTLKELERLRNENNKIKTNLFGYFRDNQMPYRSIHRTSPMGGTSCKWDGEKWT